MGIYYALPSVAFADIFFSLITGLSVIPVLIRLPPLVSIGQPAVHR